MFVGGATLQPTWVVVGPLGVGTPRRAASRVVGLAFGMFLGRLMWHAPRTWGRGSTKAFLTLPCVHHTMVLLEKLLAGPTNVELAR